MNTLTPGEETMIGALARQVKDGDWAACGTLSPLPAAALWLAQFTHAPRAQIDGQGTINLMAIGPYETYERPKVRLPGGAGSAILAYVVERVVLFKTDHAARGLVAAVDTVTAPGYTPELSPWQRPGRVTGLITPKCVFNFSPPQPPRLASLHPGVTLEEVRQLTGFAFEADGEIPATPPLDPEARGLLYGPVKAKLVQAYPHFAARLQIN
jgi:glutaconate CoA-transferase subunit B